MSQSTKPPLWRDYEVDRRKAEELRVRIYEYARSHRDEIDLADVQNRISPPENASTNNNLEWMLKRLLISTFQNVDKALAKFIEFFRYRAQFQVGSMTEQNVLPIEFYQIQPFDSNGIDKDGNRVIVMRLRNYKKMPQFELLLKRTVLYYVEQLDLEYERGTCDGVCILLDCQDFSVMEVDLDLIQFVDKQIPLSYDGTVQRIIIYEIRTLLTYLIKVVEMWLPVTTDMYGNKHRLFYSLNRKNIDEIIDQHQRPYDIAEGTMQTKVDIPSTALPLEQVALQIKGFELKNVKKIKQYLDQLIAKA